MSENLEVVVVQSDVNYGEPELNINLLTKLTSQVQLPKEQQSLFMLPELFLTGYDPQTINTLAEVLGEGKSTHFLLDLAKNKESWIFASLPERHEDSIFNTAVLVSPDGVITHSYRKVHLFRPLNEHIIFQPGNEVVVGDLPWGRTGLAICYDLRFAELFLRFRSAKTALILLCAEWPLTRADHWVNLVRARAIENQCFFASVNRVGTDPTGTYGGHSLVVDPKGQVLAQLGSQTSLASVRINFEEVLRARELFDISKEALLPASNK